MVTREGLLINIVKIPNSTFFELIYVLYKIIILSTD
jgi:hypothetical protein